MVQLVQPKEGHKGLVFFVSYYLLTKNHEKSKNSDSEATGLWFSYPISVLLCVRKYIRGKVFKLSLFYRKSIIENTETSNNRQMY